MAANPALQQDQPPPATSVIADGAAALPAKPQRSGVPILLPVLVLVAALCAALNTYLAALTGPVAQGFKLVYAGAIAGIISRTACAPLEMVSTIMMCRGDASKGMRAELRRAWADGGFQGLFKGNLANCLKVAPNRGTQFLVYEFLKRQLVAGSVSLNAGSRLFAGGIAGMVAAALVYPLEVVKTILTLYPAECKGSIFNACGAVIRHGGGFKGFYNGLAPTLVAMFPYVGVEFMVYETLKRRWVLFTGEPATTLVLLALGALAGCAGQASAHPLDVIRRRMQMQTMKKATNDDGKPPIDNMFHGLYSVAKNEGPAVLFKGLGATCLEKAPSTAIGYFIFEGLKTALKVVSV